jgi:SAM-dependent methyltransferase
MNNLPPPIVERLRCNVCWERLGEGGDSQLVCANGHAMVLHDGFVEVSSPHLDPVSRRTFESFGYEWNAFDKIQPEDAGFWKKYFADVPLDELKGKVGLDAGCGKGRFARFTAPYLDALVAMDGSDAARAAARNLSDLGNVAVIKADLRNAPFLRGSFDFVCCLGVLHHLPDPEEGFKALLDLVAPDGLILVYVYSRPERKNLRVLALGAAGLLRKFTLGLPLPALKWLSAPIASGLYFGFVLTGKLGDRLGIRALSSLPLQTYRGRPLRSLWLDTFDRLSAPVENRYVWADLEAWFRDTGTNVVAAREDAGWFVLCRKQRLKVDEPTS